MSEGHSHTAILNMESPAEAAMDLQGDQGGIEYHPNHHLELRESVIQRADWNRRAEFWGGMWNLLIGTTLLRPTTRIVGTNTQEL